MWLKSRKHMADNITLGMVRLFVPTAHANVILMGHTLELPIRHDFSSQLETTLPDENEGEGWKDR